MAIGSLRNGQGQVPGDYNDNCGDDDNDRYGNYGNRYSSGGYSGDGFPTPHQQAPYVNSSKYPSRMATKLRNQLAALISPKASQKKEVNESPLNFIEPFKEPSSQQDLTIQQQQKKTRCRDGSDEVTNTDPAVASAALKRLQPLENNATVLNQADLEKDLREMIQRFEKYERKAGSPEERQAMKEARENTQKVLDDLKSADPKLSAEDIDMLGKTARNMNYTMENKEKQQAADKAVKALNIFEMFNALNAMLQKMYATQLSRGDTLNDRLQRII